VAGLFDISNTEPLVPALLPVADWSRVHILLDGEPLLSREGVLLLGTRNSICGAVDTDGQVEASPHDTR
jgi:hypothetical protein